MKFFRRPEIRLAGVSLHCIQREIRVRARHALGTFQERFRVMPLIWRCASELEASSDARCDAPSTSDACCQHIAGYTAPCTDHMGGRVQRDIVTTGYTRRLIPIKRLSSAHSSRLSRGIPDPERHRVIYDPTALSSGSVARHRRHELLLGWDHAHGSWTAWPERQGCPSMWHMGYPVACMTHPQ